MMKKQILLLTTLFCFVQMHAKVPYGGYYRDVASGVGHPIAEFVSWWAEFVSLAKETDVSRLNKIREEQERNLNASADDLQGKLGVVKRHAGAGTWQIGHADEYQEGLLAKIERVKKQISRIKPQEKISPKYFYTAAGLRSVADIVNPAHWGPKTGPAAAGLLTAANIMTAKARASQPIARHRALRWILQLLRLGTIITQGAEVYKGSIKSMTRAKILGVGSQLMLGLQDWLALRGTKHKKIRLASLLARVGGAATLLADRWDARSFTGPNGSTLDEERQLIENKLAGWDTQINGLNNMNQQDAHAMFIEVIREIDRQENLPSPWLKEGELQRHYERLVEMFEQLVPIAHPHPHRHPHRHPQRTVEGCVSRCRQFTMAASEEEQVSPCLICREEMNNGEECLEIQCSCKGAYHRDCLVEWFKRKTTCPTCRHYISDDQVLEEQV